MLSFFCVKLLLCPRNGITCFLFSAKEFALAGINQVCHLFDKPGKLIKFSDLVDKIGL